MAISANRSLSSKLKMEGIEEIPISVLEEYEVLLENERQYARAIEQFALTLLKQLKETIGNENAEENVTQKKFLRVKISVLEERIKFLAP